MTMEHPDYTEISEINEMIRPDAKERPAYKGELANIDPVVLGRQVRRKFGCESTKNMRCPTEVFSGLDIPTKDWEFLIEFESKYLKGWHSENRLIRKKEYDASISAFKNKLSELSIKVGDILLFEHENVSDTWHKIRVDFIHPDGNAIAASFITDSEPEYLYIIGYKGELGCLKPCQAN